MLFEMKNVAIVPVNKIRNRRIQSLAVRAPNQQNCRIFQEPPPACAYIITGVSAILQPQ
jgi:hypothetical protein